MPTILVVDDHPDNRFILSQMLRISGFTAFTANNGRDALEQVETIPFDLILMDLAMPEMDGWLATEQLKANPRYSHIPVLAVTGHITQDDLTRAHEAGCSDYVEKPVDYSRMIEKVRAYLNRCKPQALPHHQLSLALD